MSENQPLDAKLREDIEGREGHGKLQSVAKPNVGSGAAKAMTDATIERMGDRVGDRLHKTNTQPSGGANPHLLVQSAINRRGDNVKDVLKSHVEVKSGLSDAVKEGWKEDQVQKMDEDTRKKFADLTAKPYAEQAKWFLNAFWRSTFGESKEEREHVWKVTQTFISLDLKGKQGNQLDEFKSHKCLENLGETLTVLALRQQLRQIDIDMNKYMALSEYLLFKYSKGVKVLVNASQGDNQEEVDKAQAMVAQAQAAAEEMNAKLEQQKKALADVQRSEMENKKALEELNKQEKDFKDKCAALEKKSQEGSTVVKGQAAAELAQLKSQDPLPLQKAKISQAATVRKVEKDRKAAEEATAAAEAAQKEAEARMVAAVNYLEEVKNKGGCAEGAIWWMERELEAARRYMPPKQKAQMA